MGLPTDPPFLSLDHLQEKSEQLRTVANVSQLVAGFTLMAMLQVRPYPSRRWRISLCSSWFYAVYAPVTPSFVLAQMNFDPTMPPETLAVMGFFCTLSTAFRRELKTVESRRQSCLPASDFSLVLKRVCGY